VHKFFRVAVETAIILFVIVSFLWAGDANRHAGSTMQTPPVPARQSP
jgi:hypothetical protein